MKRLTDSEYRTLAQKVGFEWLGPVPESVRIKTVWKCGVGHVWSAPYNGISRGYGCPECAGNKRHSESDYQKLATSHGFIWIGAFPPNTYTPTEWRCKIGHVWNTTYNHIYSGNGCPKCAKRVPLSEANYRELATQRGFVWLGPLLPPTTMTKTEWQCKNGHIWSARYNHISSGRGCPECHLIEYRGDRVPNFRGGGIIKKHYGDGFNETKKKEIRMRDNLICMLTGECLGNVKRKAPVHHIVPARISPSNWKNSTHNLITLSPKSHTWAESHLSESIPLLRKILYDTYGYDFSDMQDYDLSRLTR